MVSNDKVQHFSIYLNKYVSSLGKVGNIVKNIFPGPPQFECSTLLQLNTLPLPHALYMILPFEKSLYLIF